MRGQAARGLGPLRNVAGAAVLAVVAVLVFAWARSRGKPPPGLDGTK